MALVHQFIYRWTSFETIAFRLALFCLTAKRNTERNGERKQLVQPPSPVECGTIFMKEKKIGKKHHTIVVVWEIHE